MQGVKVYFVSGLAADRTVFRHIRLPQPHEIVHLDWIEPLPGEPLSAYALRLSEPIDTSGPFALLGLSMGGMMVTEIALHKTPQRTILVSSIPLSAQLPPYFRWLGRLKLHTVLPIGFFLNASLVKRLFSTETREDKAVLRRMIRRADPRFIRWAMGAILSWNNAVLPPGLVQIHGTHDELLPIRFTKPTHRIRGGGHLMVMNRAAEINTVLDEMLPHS